MANARKRTTVQNGTPTTSTSRPAARRIRPNAEALTPDDIAFRAYALFLARGCEHGRDLDDWLQAERELKGAV